MVSERARMAIGVALSLVIAGAIVARSANFRWQDGPEAQPYAGDFIHEYSTAWIALHGDASLLYDFETVRAVQHDPTLIGFAWDHDSVNVPYYPPPYYALIAPLAWLDYRDAAHLWIALQALAFAAAVALLVWLHPALRPALWWALPAALFFAPLATGWVSGQKGTLWLLIFAGSYAFLRVGRPGASGAVFGLLLLKPPLALALGAVMLARREWRFVAGAAATGAALAALSLTLGMGAWQGWLGAMLEPIAQDHEALLGKSHCWLGFARVALGSYAGPAVAALTLALDAATLAALVPLWRGAGLPQGRRLGAAFCAVVVATVLISPHLYSYDLTLLLLVFAVAGPGADDWLRRALLAVFLLVTAVTTTGHPAALLASVPALFALQLLLARGAASEAR